MTDTPTLTAHYNDCPANRSPDCICDQVEVPEPSPHLTPARGPLDRITRDGQGYEATIAGVLSLDEIVLSNVTVHIERMSDGCYWIGIRDAAGLDVSASVTSQSGRIDLWVQEAEGLDGVAVDEGTLPNA